MNDPYLSGARINRACSNLCVYVYRYVCMYAVTLQERNDCLLLNAHHAHACARYTAERRVNSAATERRL